MVAPRIIITDECPLFLEGLYQVLLRLFPGAEVLPASKGICIMEQMAKEPADLVFLDCPLGGAEGLELIHSVRRHFNQVHIVAVIDSDDTHSIFKLFEAGANGYLHRNSEPGKVQEVVEIVTGIRLDQTDQNISRHINGESIKSHNGQGRMQNPELSAREKEILILICRQYSSREIAQQLHLTEKTVETHRNHLMLKTRSKNVVGLILYAIEGGYFQPHQR
jgi:DNA-binding NarL/FixJ family response regulator